MKTSLFAALAIAALLPMAAHAARQPMNIQTVGAGAGIEPVVKVSRDQTIFIAAHNNLYRSTDGGQTLASVPFTNLAPAVLAGNQSSIDVDANGGLYLAFSYPTLGSTAACFSTDHGDTFTCSPAAVPGITDRMWVFSAAPTQAYLVAREGTNHNVVMQSTDQSTWTPFSAALEPNPQYTGPLVKHLTGPLMQTDRDGAGGNTGLYVMPDLSAVIPVDPTNPSVPNVAVPTLPSTEFRASPLLPPLGINTAVYDRAGHLWLNGESQTASGGRQVTLAYSNDSGLNWVTLPKIAPLASGATTFSWVLAGEEGHVGVLAYHTNSEDPLNPLPNATWSVVFVETYNALDANPTWTLYTLEDAAHVGTFCIGLNCTSGTGQSANANFAGNFISGVFDNTGRAHLSWVDEVAGATRLRYGQIANFIPPPPTLSFSVTPPQTTIGGTATLQWASVGANTCTASDSWTGSKATSGSEDVPAGTTVGTVVYTLTCVGDGGSVIKSTNLLVTDVVSPAPTVSLSANPTSTDTGTSTTLTWSTNDATDCTASGDWTGGKATAGSESVAVGSVVGTRTYTLSCTGPGGSGSHSVDVTVTSPTPAPTVSISSSNNNPNTGDTITLSWSSTDASDCTAGGQWSGTMPTSGTQDVPVGNTAGDRTYTLTCVGPGGSGSNQVIVHVTAASSGALSFNTNTDTTSEGTAADVITVRRTGGDLGVVSIQVTTADGTATAGQDYDAVNTTLTWADGDAADKTVQTRIIADSTPESTETFTWTLSAPTGGATIGAIDTHTTSITDVPVTSTPGTIAFAVDSDSVAESAGSDVLVLTRSGGSSGTASVRVTTADGTATAGQDYTAVNTIVTWADGDSADKTVSTTITNDSIAESNETFTWTLSQVGGASLGSPSTHTSTIIDGGAPSAPGAIGFSLPSDSVAEAAGSDSVTLHRTGGSNGVVSVHVTTSDGSATAGQDYIAVDTTVTWSDGDATDKTVSTTIFQDAANESDETFTWTVGSPQGGATLDSHSTHVTTINDSTPPVSMPGSVQFATAADEVSENTPADVIILQRVGGSQGAISVHVQSRDGTAQAGSDYGAVDTIVTWADGDAADKTFSVPIYGDTVTEPDETLTLDLSNPTGNATLGSPSSHTATIHDSTQSAAANPPPAKHAGALAPSALIVLALAGLRRRRSRP